jgi:hypothetical protein
LRLYLPKCWLPKCQFPKCWLTNVHFPNVNSPNVKKYRQCQLYLTPSWNRPPQGLGAHPRGQFFKTCVGANYM